MILNTYIYNMINIRKQSEKKKHEQWTQLCNETMFSFGFHVELTFSKPRACHRLPWFAQLALSLQGLPDVSWVVKPSAPKIWIQIKSQKFVSKFVSQIWNLQSKLVVKIWRKVYQQKQGTVSWFVHVWKSAPRFWETFEGWSGSVSDVLKVKMQWPRQKTRLNRFVDRKSVV